MVLESVLDPVFSPLLTLPSWLAILIISVVITTLTTIAYKYLTDQTKMKALKKEMKGAQKRMKELSKSDPQKAMKMQKDMMGKNMELMRHSFKPTLYTLIPIIIIFGWLNSHMAYDPLLPNEPFSVTVDMDKGTTGSVEIDTIPELQFAKDETLVKNVTDGSVMWTMRGGAGEYQLTFTHSSGSQVDQEVLVTDEPGMYEQPLVKIRQQPFSTVKISNDKIRPLEGFPLVGNWGWIGIYIIFSLIISFSLRKALKVA
ncbi:DUF106 domain-containing protein [Candidatus Woesearchaeota archaeon]|nr:DUF106 domain-containing protein [Candidatus Woesearchaeota archaeon]